MAMGNVPNSCRQSLVIEWPRFRIEAGEFVKLECSAGHDETTLRIQLWTVGSPSDRVTIFVNENRRIEKNEGVAIKAEIRSICSAGDGAKKRKTNAKNEPPAIRSHNQDRVELFPALLSAKLPSSRNFL